MATVKLHSNGKVVTKSGKVACTCCESPTICCMYPADQLGVGYEEEDLPNILTSNYNPPFISGDFTRVAGFLGTPFVGIYPPTIYYTGSGTESSGIGIRNINDGSGLQWLLYGYDGLSWAPLAGIGECLINADTAEIAEDQFEPTYQVGGDTVTRVSLCLWSGPKTGGGTWALRYNSTTTKWNLNGTEKTGGNQSDPTGAYTAGTVS
jgi:hypothetical protein